MENKNEKASPRKKLIVFIAYLSIGMLGVYITFYQYTVLNLTQLLNLNITMMGLLIAMQHIGISIPPVFIGTLCNKIGKKKVVLLSYAMIILGTFLTGISQSFITIMFSVLIIGAGFSVTEGTLSAVLADEFPDESTKHINFSQVAFSIGALCGPFIAKALIEGGIFFKNLYFFNSVIFFLLAIIFLFTKFKNDKGNNESSGVSFSVLKFLKTRVFLLLAFAIFIYVGIENTVANFADSYFELELIKPQFSAAALALFWGAMIPSRLLAGFIKIKPKIIFTSMSALVFISILLAMITPNYYMKIAMFALCGFGCGPIWPLIMDTTAKKNVGSSGPALNVMMAFSGLGGALLPLLSGVVVDFTIQSAAYYISAVAVVILMYTYLSSLRSKTELKR
jgi:MFS transporter, FHS family, glucose/mannose:H+ symporter